MGLRRSLPQATDVALASAFAVAAQVELRFPTAQSDIHGAYAGNVVLALATTLPLAWRRRAPLPALFTVFAAYLLDAAFQSPTNLTYGGGVPLLVLFYSAGRHASMRRALTGLLVGAGWMAVLAWRSPTIRSADELVFDVVLFGGGWAFGRALRLALDRERRAAGRAAALAVEAEQRERALLADERARIARELHDVIAHSVSVIVIQAGAAARVLDSDPEVARASLDAIRRTGKDTVGELHRLLGLLRVDDPASSVGPQQGLAALDDLVARVREAGVLVEVERCSDGGLLPPGVDQAAYRIVQEALTNVLKHSGVRTVKVAVTSAGEMLRITVVDDGHGRDDAAVPGHGLVGMRERTALYGGRVAAGPAPGGGFRVQATLAVPADRAPAVLHRPGPETSLPP